ncbi:MAG: hypothetical protein AAF378_25265 [Cyanobacteria bacterium P01_A01_bin.84]
MSQTVISGTIPNGAKKVVGKEYTAEYVKSRDDIYAELEAISNQIYKKYGYGGDESDPEYKKLLDQYNKIRDTFYEANIVSGYIIKFDSLPQCDIVCQAWEFDDAVTCVSFGMGENYILVTTLAPDGTFKPATFSFMATEYTSPEQIIWQ